MVIVRNENSAVWLKAAVVFVLCYRSHNGVPHAFETCTGKLLPSSLTANSSRNTFGDV